MLTKTEKDRYSRQIDLEGFGIKGQKKLKESKVLIIGVGGLGCAVSTYLTLTGIGQILLVDPGFVDLNNLNRQSLYSEQDIGRSKVGSAKEKLSVLNPNIKIEIMQKKFDDISIQDQLEEYNIIVDALDNLNGRFILNNYVLSRHLPLFHGAVYSYGGRITTIIPGKTPCLRCIYRSDQILIPKEIPVFSVVPAIIGCLQASEVVKYILGIGKLLCGRLLLYDGLSQEFYEVPTQIDPCCSYCS